MNEQQRFSFKLKKKEDHHGSYPILKTDWDILRFETLLRELKMEKTGFLSYPWREHR